MKRHYTDIVIMHMIQRKILLINDNPNLRDALEMFLENENYQVISWTESEKKILLSSGADIAIIEMTYYASAEDIQDIVKQIKHSTKNIHLLFISTQKEDKVYCKTISGSHFLEEPFSGNQLLKKLTDLSTQKE